MGEMRAFRRVDLFSRREHAVLYGRQGCLPPHFLTGSKASSNGDLVLGVLSVGNKPSRIVNDEDNCEPHLVAL